MNKEININIGTIGNINSNKTNMTEILKNVEKYLDKLTEEERNEYFKKMEFSQEILPNNIKERAQINKKLTKQKKKEYPKK